MCVSTPGVCGGGGHMIDGSKPGWSRANIGQVSGYIAWLWRGSFTHHRELAATFFDALRGAEQEDARGNACEDPADRADDADGAYGEADHRDEGAVPHACTV